MAVAMVQTTGDAAAGAAWIVCGETADPLTGSSRQSLLLGARGFEAAAEAWFPRHSSVCVVGHLCEATAAGAVCCGGVFRTACMRRPRQWHSYVVFMLRFSSNAGKFET